jgi:cardiolipin synthase
MQPPQGLIVTLPNLITIARLVLVPMIVWLIISRWHGLAFWLFVAAGLSDAVDGFIARQLDLRSRLGAYLDPLADKALLTSIYVALATLSEIPPWLAIMVLSRDVLIIGAVMLSWVMDRPIEVRPLIVSKITTAAQLLLAAMVLADLAFAVDFSSARSVTTLAVAALTVASASAYLIDWVRHMERT